MLKLFNLIKFVGSNISAGVWHVGLQQSFFTKFFKIYLQKKKSNLQG